ncbi:MAG: hypothetical protein ACUVX1_06685 [Chloroflexota bacterium]
MNCDKCGAPISEDSDVCWSCGAARPGSGPGLGLTYSASPGGLGTSGVSNRIRPMGVGDILDEMIRLFRQNFLTFIGIAAVPLVPMGVLQMLQMAIVGYGVDSLSTLSDEGVYQFGPSALSLLLSLVSFLATLLCYAALTSAVSQRYLGQAISVGGSYGLAIPHFWRLLGASMLIGVVALALSLTVIGIPVAIFLVIRWAIFMQAVVIEGQGFGLTRSSSLVKGTWWRVFGILIVAGIFLYVLYLIPTLLIAIPLGIAALVAIPESFLLFSAAFLVVNTLLGIVTAPIIPIVSTLLYYDLRIRKEGFDLEMINERLAQG